MKWISFLVFAFSVQAFANNPLIHYCKITGGEFHVVEASGNEIPMCRYGSAMIDALSVLETTAGLRETTAAKLVLSEGAKCADTGNVLPSKDLEGNPFSLCRFKDGSSLETKTLAGGINSSENTQLIQALQMRF